MTKMLRAGDQFPELPLVLNDETLCVLPSGLVSDYTILLVYRGHW